jgi:hypothetical protein
MPRRRTRRDDQISIDDLTHDVLRQAENVLVGGRPGLCRGLGHAASVAVFAEGTVEGVFDPAGRSRYTCCVADRPYFAWDVDVTEAELRDKLRCADADARAQWQGWVMAEARYRDVWRFLSLAEILRDWQHIRLHLGRKRVFWEFLLDGWRTQGLINA